MPPERWPDAAGFVLAGGRSSRMGSDKAFVPLGGRLLIEHALDTLREAGLLVAIAGGCSALARFGQVVADSGQGPLSGICAALATTSAELSVFLPIDMPCLPASLIKCLLGHARLSGAAVTCPSISGFAQTFPAVIDRAALSSLNQMLGQQRGGCFVAFKQAADELGKPFMVVRTELLIQCGQVTHPAGLPGGYWFLNVNAKPQLARAEALLARAVA